ncbi:MAG: N-acetylglucosamine-6-phosphate deacetylase [Gloeocapsa sp. DLM2.Bin57]|nr:MAG: N-acetylglucosamine-6-phosphate deacetylase [Gloeocapsa sp. DLM2.Bin57]
MNQPVKIIQARLPGVTRLREININSEGKIESGESNNQNYQVIDLGGDWLSLGGVDLQINGALGTSFTDLTQPEELSPICEFLATQGIDGFLPTIITTSREKIRRSLATIAKYCQNPLANAATILGVHLEGPFLNRAKRGAHPQEYLLPLTKDNLEGIIDGYQDLIKIITLAPELDDTGAIIPYLISQGIIVSLGHSLATASQARLAFSQGATMVTHAFNAMPSLHHREPGLLGEAIINEKVSCGVIADGEHVCLTMLKILLRASNYEQGLFLVSDALAPIGLPYGCYPWDKRTIRITEGTAKLEDDTLAGTTLPLLTGVENLVKWGICEPSEAISLATVSPRRILSLPGILPGQPGRFLRWSWHQETSQLTWSKLNFYVQNSQ